MAFTKEQEEFLTDFADKGLAEQDEIKTRNKQVLLDTKVQEARTAKEAELKAQAQALVNAGLEDFETNVVPTIEVDAKPKE